MPDSIIIHRQPANTMLPAELAHAFLRVHLPQRPNFRRLAANIPRSGTVSCGQRPKCCARLDEARYVDGADRRERRMQQNNTMARCRAGGEC